MAETPVVSTYHHWRWSAKPFRRRSHLPLRWDLTPVQVGRNFGFPEINGINGRSTGSIPMGLTVGRGKRWAFWETGGRKKHENVRFLLCLCPDTSYPWLFGRCQLSHIINFWSSGRIHQLKQVGSAGDFFETVHPMSRNPQAMYLGYRLCELLLFLLLFFLGRLSSGLLCCLQGNTSDLTGSRGTPNYNYTWWFHNSHLSENPVRNQQPTVKPPVKPSKPLWTTVFFGSCWRLVELCWVPRSGFRSWLLHCLFRVFWVSFLIGDWVGHVCKLERHTWDLGLWMSFNSHLIS